MARWNNQLTEVTPDNHYNINIVCPYNHDSTLEVIKENTSKGKKNGKSNGKGKLCPNCQKPGHDTDNCWAPGGGKEHEAPDWYKKKAGKSKNTASLAVAPNVAFITTTTEVWALPAAAGRPPVIFDTGATRPIVPEEHVFDKLTPTSVETANKNSPLKAVGSGNATFLPPLNNASASLGRSGTPFMRPMRPARSSRYRASRRPASAATSRRAR